MSRRFRTDSDGRIALATDWLALLHEVRRAGPFSLQTRRTSTTWRGALQAAFPALR